MTLPHRTGSSVRLPGLATVRRHITRLAWPKPNAPALRAGMGTLILPLALTLLLLLSPLMPGILRPATTAAAGALPPAATTTAVRTAQFVPGGATIVSAIAEAVRPPVTTQSTTTPGGSVQSDASPGTTAQSDTTRGVTAQNAPAGPTAPSARVLLPSARPLNAPETVVGASTTQAGASPTPVPPTPTPTSPYRLPWPGGEALTVVQGNNSTFSHQGLEAFAWDFVMPTGSIIEAARAGTVRYVRDDSNAGGDDVNLFGWAGNYVVVDQGDGTSSLYMHLMFHGALVRVGQAVQQGEAIADSGATGFSTGPHLHFMVERTEPGVWYDQSLPVTFADVTNNGGVPVQGQTYTSGNAPHAFWQSSGVVNRLELPAVGLPRPAAPAVPGVQGTGTYTWPVVGPVISPATTQQTAALIGGPAGAAVVAADTGTVVFSGTDGIGVSVVIDHGNGDLTVYARLVRALVLPGDIVQRGQSIGILGQIIAGLPIHVAVALYEHGQSVNPVTHYQSGLPPAPLPQVLVPNLIGLSPAQATKAVAGLQVTVAMDSPQSSTSVAAGQVASQQPAANVLAPIRSVIHLNLSSGPPTPTPTPLPTTMPAPTAVTAVPLTSATPLPTPPATGAAPAPTATPAPAVTLHASPTLAASPSPSPKDTVVAATATVQAVSTVAAVKATVRAISTATATTQQTPTVAGTPPPALPPVATAGRR